MHTLEITGELSTAIKTIENLLNGENGEDILNEIRRYKKLKGNTGNYSRQLIRK